MNTSEPLFRRPPQASDVIGWCLIWLAFLQLLWQFFGYEWIETLNAHRFATDNAPSAAANALEYIASRIWLSFSVRPGDWLIAGILCLIYGRLSKP
jgi:hypothetical protein